MSRGMCCGRLDAVEPVSLALSPSRSSVSLWFIVSVSRRTALDMRSVVEHIENVQSLYIFKNESPTAGFRSKLLYAESASSFIPSTSSCSLSSRFMSSCTHHLVTLSTLSQSITTSVFHCRLETLLFLPRCALQCKARSWDHMSSVRLSACLSVTLVDCDHIGWNSSKIISPLVSLGCSLFATPNIPPPPSWIISNGHISQQLTIYLYRAHRAVIFAIAQLSCLSARRYANADNSDRNVSVRLSVRHELVLCQNEESYSSPSGSPMNLVF